MKITIITVCRNAAGVVGTAIESVLRQTWPNIEHVLVVGDSADGTRPLVEALAAQHGPAVKCVFEPTLTIYEALNRGIALATGDVVGLLHADDALGRDDVLDRVAEAFEQDASLQTVYGDVRFVANRANVSLDDLRGERTVRHYSARLWRPWMLQWGFMPPHPSLYVRKPCFARLGVYATDYAIAADYALMIRFFRDARVKSAYLPMSFVDMRMGGLSTKGWGSTIRLNREIVRANRESGFFCCLAMLLPKYAFKLFEFVGPWLRRVVRRGKRPCEC